MYPGGRVTTSPLPPPASSARRSCETVTWSALTPVSGGRPSHSSSSSRSLGTTSFAWSRSIARSARWRVPPRATGRPSSTASTGPRIRNSIAVPRADATTAPGRRKPVSRDARTRFAAVSCRALTGPGQGGRDGSHERSHGAHVDQASASPPRLCRAHARGRVAAADGGGPRFATPTNLGRAVNTAGFEGGPALSADGLTLYFASNRPGGSGGADLWAASRRTATASFGGPRNLGPVLNTRGEDTAPESAAGGLELYFGSDRAGRTAICTSRSVAACPRRSAVRPS